MFFSKVIAPFSFLVIVLSVSCSGPNELMVGNVRVAPLTGNEDSKPQVFSLSMPIQQAMDKVKIDLIQTGWMTREIDSRLGIIITDYKTLGYDEDYTIKSSIDGGATAAALIFGLVAVGAAVAVTSSIADHNDTVKTTSKNAGTKRNSKYKDDDADDDDHHNRHCAEKEESKIETIETNRGRLQIRFLPVSDSAKTQVLVTGYIAKFVNGVLYNENVAIRIHPLIQKYSCLFSGAQNCSDAPGQSRYVMPASYYSAD